MRYSLLVLLLLCASGATTGRAADPGVKVRVTILDFASDDNSWRNARVAKDFSRALQAVASQNGDWDWVERQQLELPHKELQLQALAQAGGASALHPGKWLKTDFVVLGRFEGSNNQRSLLLEVVDQQRAELLADNVIALQTPAAEPLSRVVDELNTVSKALEKLLAQAKQRFAEMKSQRSIAFLFCEGGGRSYNAFELEQEFLAALQKSSGGNAAYRLARYPYSNRARSEAELVLGGSVECDWEKFQQISDYYLWVLVKGDNRSLAPTAVELSIWNGVAEPKVITVPIGTNTTFLLAQQMAASTLQALNRFSPEAPSDQLREKISATVWNHAHGLIKGDLTGIRFSPESVEGRRQLFNLMRLLETACYFNPLNREAQAERIWNRWNYLQNDYWTRWKAYQAWGEHVERFGFDLLLTNRPSQLNASNLVVAYLRSGLLLAHLLNIAEKTRYGFPLDTPVDVAKEASQELRAELVRRTLKAATLPAAAPYLAEVLNSLIPEYIPPSPRQLASTNVFDPNGVTPSEAEMERRLVQGVWPHLVEYVNRTGRMNLWEPIKPTIQRRFAEIGKPEEADKLYLMFKPPEKQAPVLPKPAPRPESARIPVWFETGRLDLLPPEINFPFTNLAFPADLSVDKVHSLAWYKNKLWVLATGTEIAKLDGPIDMAKELQPVRQEITRVWVYDPEKAVLSRPPAPVDELKSVDFLWAPGNDLWIGLPKEGLRRIEQNGTVSSPTNGLPVGNYTPATGPDNAIYLAEGKEFPIQFNSASGLYERLKRVVYQFDAASASWRTHEVPPGRSRKVFNSRLVLFYELEPSQVQELQLQVRPLFQPRQTLQWNCIALDNAGNPWLGNEMGLQFMDTQQFKFANYSRTFRMDASNPLYLPKGAIAKPPNVQKKAVEDMAQLFRSWKGLRIRVTKDTTVSPLLPRSRIPGAVTALAHDGEFLWIVSRSDDDWWLMLLHKPSLSWVGRCKIPGYRIYAVPAIAVSESHVWLGLTQSRYQGGCQPLLRVDRAAALKIPRSQWVPDKISEAELAAVEGWPNREQAVLAFFSGDYAKTIKLLSGDEPSDMDLESLYLMGCSYDRLGMQKPAEARKYLAEIIRREKDTPWGIEASNVLSGLQDKAQASSQPSQNK